MFYFIIDSRNSRFNEVIFPIFPIFQSYLQVSFSVVRSVSVKRPSVCQVTSTA